MLSSSGSHVSGSRLTIRAANKADSVSESIDDEDYSVSEALPDDYDAPLEPLPNSIEYQVNQTNPLTSKLNNSSGNLEWKGNNQLSTGINICAAVGSRKPNRFVIN